MKEINVLLKSGPENDTNAEEMRNNEEEWNNNMIAAYLNTAKRNTGMNRLRSLTLSLAYLLRLEKQGTAQTTVTKKLLLQRIKREILFRLLEISFPVRCTLFFHSHHH